MSIHNDTWVDGDCPSLRSDAVAAASLRLKVFAARNAANLTVTALAAATGMSPRTIRDIEEGADRAYRSTTLSALDRVFGWAPGEAYATWRAGEGADLHPDVETLATQMAEIAEEVRRMQEQPSWALELIEACRLLPGEDRAVVLALAHRLGRGM
jgi:transcriptional regulator with XRE-family HTH domain